MERNPATKAKQKYNEKAYDRLFITVDKGKKEEIHALASRYGISINAFVNRLIDEAMQKQEP